MSIEKLTKPILLFDNDGTLVDSKEIILSSMRYATKNVLDIEYSDDFLLHKVGQPLAVQMRDFSDDEKVQARLLEAYRDHNAKIHDDRITPCIGAIQTLRLFHECGYKTGVVTSKITPIAKRGLQICGLFDYIDFCIGSDQCNTFKPNPEPLLRGMIAMRAFPHECVYIGDAPYDIQAAKNAGCTSIAVSWGMFSREALAYENPDYFVSSFNELALLVHEIKMPRLITDQSMKSLSK